MPSWSFYSFAESLLASTPGFMSADLKELRVRVPESAARSPPSRCAREEPVAHRLGMTSFSENSYPVANLPPTITNALLGLRIPPCLHTSITVRRHRRHCPGLTAAGERYPDSRRQDSSEPEGRLRFCFDAGQHYGFVNTAAFSGSYPIQRLLYRQ